MEFPKSHDVQISKVIKLVYEVNGQEYEAVPVTDNEAKAAGLTPAAAAMTSCDGHYICMEGWRYRWMLNHATKQCQYFRTNEVC